MGAVSAMKKKKITKDFIQFLEPAPKKASSAIWFMGAHMSTVSVCRFVNWVITEKHNFHLNDNKFLQSGRLTNQFS